MGVNGGQPTASFIDTRAQDLERNVDGRVPLWDTAVVGNHGPCPCNPAGLQTGL